MTTAVTLVPALTSGPTIDWYLARGTGVVALLLLTASVVLGILGPLRAASERWPRFALGTLHRDVSLLVIALLVVHIATSVIDGFAPIGLLDGIIPFASPYRPLWLGLGAVAFDLLLALVVTSLVRRRLGYRTWRAVHWLAYVSWPVAVLHGLGTGTDAKQGWSLVLTACCVTVVLLAVWRRLAGAAVVRGVPRAAWAGLSVAVSAGIALFAVLGPLAPGWARRAGTPAKLLGAHRVRVATVTPAPAPAAAVSRTPVLRPGQAFSASLNGRIRQTPQPGGDIVDLVFSLGGGASGRLQMRLAGLPDGSGGISLTGSQVDLAALGLPSTLDGRITALDGTQIVARVRGRDGLHYELRASLQLDNGVGTATGSLRGVPLR